MMNILKPMWKTVAGLGPNILKPTWKTVAVLGRLNFETNPSDPHAVGSRKYYAADQREGERCGGRGLPLPVAAWTRSFKPTHARSDHPVESGAAGTLAVTAVRQAVQDGREGWR